MPDTYFDLFLGYSVIWLIVLLYVFYLSRRLTKVNNRLSESLKNLD